MLRRGVLFLLLVASVSPGLRATTRPNLVIIMADDLGYGDLGCYGNQRIKTPHLDELAATGVRFTDFHSSGPVCSPTRAGLLTGRYQQRAGIPSVVYADPKRTTHTHGLQPREVTFAELLKDAGYKTAIFGKWHLGYYEHYNPIRHGFQVFRGYVSGNVDFFSHVDQVGRLDWWRDEKVDNEPGYTTNLITRHALDYIEANRHEPFCLYLPYEPPHYPYQGPNDEPLRSVGEGRSQAEINQPAEQIQRAYREMVETMDDGIGQIIAALNKYSLKAKTLVLFFSDNGANQNGSNGLLRGRKGQLWEGGHRVPFIAWWPSRIPPGVIYSDMTITLDIMPTLLSAAGVEPSPRLMLDGLDLLPLLTSGESLGRRTLFWGFGSSKAMREGPWKLVVNAPGQQEPELFNLDSDMQESANLASDEPKRVRRMLAAIKEWEAEVNATASPQPLN